MKRQRETAHKWSSVLQLQSPRWRPMTGARAPGSRRREKLLCLVCLAVFTVMLTGSQGCSEETIATVDEVLQEVQKKPFDCKLYTPDLVHYEQSCPNSMLTCFANEVEVLLYEGTFNKSWKLQRRLLLLTTKKDKDSCSQCELYPEKAAKEFLLDLQSFLQMICS